MIQIERKYLEAVRAAGSPHELHESLQAAVVLELATIPPYLTAYFSLKPGENGDVGALVRSVVIEEMLHLTIAANVLNAVGGRPVLDSKEAVLDYPSPLPMGTVGGLVVHLGPMSIPQTELFMAIEQPEDPIADRAGSDVVTIGDFYAAIIDKIKDLGEPAFATPSAPQVTAPFYPSSQLFAVTDVASAARALEIVVEQGEGTATSPEDGDGEGDLAHYYRFAEIRHGRRLVPDRTAPEGYSYTGDPVVFDPSGVHPMITDPEVGFYPEGTKAGTLTEQFNRSFRHLLVALQKTFTGHPSALDAAMGIMYELRLLTIEMSLTPDPRPEHANNCVTPCWGYGTLD
ncbi:ferritin-like protein [Actinophytocola sp.]|uniref:ferritin-like domain-containing protein n=1 Tax=Actinophytocola sp. TaxID=1872138 RepID=UPI002D2BEE1E|nr:ferritin-like protein [Actinophytocola sp.]HYQ62580.1 ferritin-like protein [Actinophytocola sp.]